MNAQRVQVDLGNLSEREANFVASIVVVLSDPAHADLLADLRAGVISLRMSARGYAEIVKLMPGAIRPEHQLN